MSEMEDKLNSILSNPQMMEQIMTLAQSLGKTEPNQSESAHTPQPLASGAGLNPNLMKKVSSILQKGTIDANQQSLLKALTPYLSSQKISKLERAMQAARMAGIASEMVTSHRISPLRGR